MFDVGQFVRHHGCESLNYIISSIYHAIINVIREILANFSDGRSVFFALIRKYQISGDVSRAELLLYVKSRIFL